MSRSTLDLLTGLLDAHRYDDAVRLVRALPARTPDDRRLLATALELCAACRADHERVLDHWQAAADGAASVARRRERLTAVLDRVLGADDDVPTPPLGVPVDPGGLTVRCLGPLQVLRGGHDLGPLPNRRAKSVFKYLLLHRGRPTPKGVLMDLFWPDATPEAARNNLNVAVYALRRYLGGPDGHRGTVVFRDDGYGLDAGLRLDVDLDAFDVDVDAAATARRHGDVDGELRRLRAAQAFHRGVLFADDLYEEWVFPHRQAVLDRLVGVLERLASRYREAGDQQARVAVLRAILEVQPAHEEAHRGLMRAHVALGRPHLALRQYEECVAALRDELGVGPSPVTEALVAALNQRPLSPCP